MGNIKNAYKVLIGKHEGKKSLGKHRCRCKDNTIMDLKNVACEGMDWIYLAQDGVQWRVLENRIINLWVGNRRAV
jgi:hypothetical protein